MSWEMSFQRKTCWSTIREIVRPGTYLSGDFASAPLGNQGSHRGAVLLEDAADKGLHKSGLSPDSYAAIVVLEMVMH